MIRLTTLIALTLCYRTLVVQACFPGGISPEDCPTILGETTESCSTRSIFLGKRHANDLSLGLYRSVSQDETVDQENFLLLPTELSTIISILIRATEDHENQMSTLDQIRCYVDDFKRKMESTIAVPNEFNPPSTKEEKVPENKDIPKMITSHRKMFLDQKLKAEENYTAESLCYYQMPFELIDFETDDNARTVVNNWAKETNDKSMDKIANVTEDDPGYTERKPIAGDPEVVKNDRVVVASTVFFRVAWRSSLFSSLNIVQNAPFFVKPRGKGDHKQSEVNVPVSYLQTKGSFPYCETNMYAAIRLPMHESTDGSVVFIVPKGESCLHDLEEELISSDNKLQSFLDGLKTSTDKKVRSVSIPRLTLQVTHEWSTPSNKSLVDIKTEADYGLKGDQVGVYQDTYIEMIENTGAPMPLGQSEGNFTANQPFLFIIEIDQKILAIGRVKDPYWCKFCHTEKKES